MVSPEEEAPPALFETSIGDADVNFFASGSWETRLAFVTGLLLRPGFPVTWLDSFPEENVGFLYENDPDLTLSVRLKKKYFLELSVLKDFNKNSFLMGYEGKGNEPLRRLYIGNRDISIPPLPFIDIPEAGNASIGASALLGWKDGASHSLMVRYDLEESKEKSFLGKNEIEKRTIDIGNYIRGRYFYLPDRNVDSLRLFVRDSTGDLLGSDSYRYRILDPSEYVFNNSAGEIYLKSDPGERLIVYYTKGGISVGDGSLGKAALPGFNGTVYDFTLPPVNFNWGTTYMGIDMNDLAVVVDGKKCLILWDNGKFSPFQICNTYDIGENLPADASKIDIKLYKKGAFTPESINGSFDFIFYHDRGSVEVLPKNGGEFEGSESFKRYYPFFDSSPVIYGPESSVKREESGYTLKVRILTPVSEYSLGEGVIPGSVHVEVNGVEETRFRVNYDTGKITFPFDVKPTDYIDITYKTESAGASGGDILAVWESRIDLTKLLQLTIGGGVRWNLLPGSYTVNENSRTGMVLGSVGLSYRNDSFSASGSVAVGYSNPNTTGTLRVAGMDNRGVGIEISEDNIFPSSVPDPASFASVGVEGITRDTRGKLFYKNYRSYGPFGSVSLIYYDDPIPAGNVYDYKTGSKCGPYIAGGSSTGRSGKSLVLDYSIPSSKKWVGVEIPMSGKGGRDYSSIDSISLSFKGDAIKGRVRVYIQIGEIGEDLDGDGVLDREGSKFSYGFDFDDTSNGVVLLIGGGPQGTGNLIEDSEDFNGNGFLDRDDPNYIVSFTSPPTNDLLSFSGSTEWRRYTYFLTDAERKRLIDTRSIRIIVLREDSGDVRGRILIDRITLNGSSFIASSSSGHVYTEEFPESDLSLDCVSVSKSLVELFPELSGVVNQDTREQMILGIRWDSVSSKDGFSVRHYLANSIERADYGELVFYAGYCGSEADGTLNLSLVDSLGRGIRVSLGISRISGDIGHGWHKVTVELEKKQIFVDGVLSGEGTVSVDSDSSPLSELKIGVRDSSSGFLFLDEVLLKRPSGRLGGAFKANLNYSVKGPLYSVGGIDVISDLKLRVRSFLETPGFSALYGIPGSYYTYFSSLENEFKLLGSDVGLNLLVSGQGGSVYFTIGHSLRMPGYIIPLSLSDSYSERFGGIGDFYKSNGIFLNLPGGNEFRSNFKASYSEGILSREWSGGVNFGFGKWAKSNSEVSFSRSEKGYSYSPKDYVTNWVTSFRLVDPTVLSSLLDRDVKIKNREMINLSGLGVFSIGLRGEGIGEVHSFNFSGNYRDAGNTYQVSLSLPLKIDTATGLTVEPRYERLLSLIDTVGYTGCFLSDVNNLWLGVESNSYFYRAIPFVELYDTSLLTDVERSGGLFEQITYKPSVSLTLSRNYGSYVRDLFLPSSMTLEFNRRIRSEYSIVTQDFTSGVKLKTMAINLFGKLGAYRYFDFYRTDEFDSSLSLELRGNGEGEVDSYTFGIIHYVNLVGNRNEYSLQNNLTLEGDWRGEILERIKDTLDLSFKWRTDYVPFLFKKLLPDNWADVSFLENEENLRYIYLSRDSGDTLLPVSLIFEHWTKLRVEKRGFIGINIGTGFSMEDSNSAVLSQSLYRIFFKVGLRAKITF